MRTEDPVAIGLIGCGNISAVYLRNCATFDNLSVEACADLEPGRAQTRAQEFGIPKVLSVDSLLADPEIEVVLNLTVPLAHASVSLAALEAGKHVYSEKPLAVERAGGQRILEAARDRGLCVGCAPDTFMGNGLQTVRHCIDMGAIGRPVAASAFFMTHGAEMWHPDPDFLYQPGAGPVFDMGPYYLTALAALLGPVQRVSALSQISFPERTITSQPKYGTPIAVRVPTHVAALLAFSSGASATCVASWDVWHHHLPDLEVYGSSGSIWAPDPNMFHGDALLRREGWKSWLPIVSDSPYSDNWRGIGLMDMARAIRTGGRYRASSELAYHVLDVMHAILDAAATGTTVEVTSTFEPPELMPLKVTLPAPSEPAVREDPWLLDHTL